MLNFIIYLVFFHLFNYFLFRVYTKEQKIDYVYPTMFESMLFWPMILLNIKQSKLNDYSNNRTNRIGKDLANVKNNAKRI